MAKSEQQKSLTSYRKEVYDYVEKLTGKLSPTQHEELKSILTSVYEHRVIDVNPAKPVHHEILCPKCRGITKKVGPQFKQYKKSARRAGLDV